MIKVGDCVRSGISGRTGIVKMLHNRGGTIVPASCRVLLDGDLFTVDAAIDQLTPIDPPRWIVKHGPHFAKNGASLPSSFFVHDTHTGRSVHKTYSGQNWKDPKTAQRTADRLNAQK